MFLAARLLALALLWLPLVAAAHPIVPREDLDAIVGVSSTVVSGEVIQVVATRGSAGPTEVTILVHGVLKGEAPAALTFAAAEEHGTRWVVRDRGFFFLARNPVEGPPFVSVALHAESPRYLGGDGRRIEAWLLAGAGGRRPEEIESFRTFESEPIRRHATWLWSQQGAGESEGISVPGALVAGAFSLGMVAFAVLRDGRRTG